MTGTIDSASEYTMTINVTAVNDSPTVANAIPNQAATVGTTFSYQFPEKTFMDLDDDSLTYSATKSDGSPLPSWLNFNASSRTFSGTPASGDTGTITIKVTASDDNDSASDDFNIVVKTGTTAPAKPTGFTATAGNAEVTLSWINPGNNAITKWQYRKRVFQGSWTDGDWTDISGSGSNTTSHKVTGLINGTRYFFQIRAVASSTNGANSDQMEATPTALPVVGIMGGDAVTEGTPASFTVSRTGSTSSALTVLLAVSENSSGGRDFVTGSDEGNKSVTIPAGLSSVIYKVPTQNDSTYEPVGRVTVAIRVSNGVYTIDSTKDEAENAVNDNDGPIPPTPVVSITGGSAITEGETAEFTLIADPPPTGTISVNVRVNDSGDFVVSDETGPRSVSIGSDGSAKLTVRTDDDSTREDGGSITANVQAGTGYTPHSSQASYVIPVTDNDGGKSPPVANNPPRSNTPLAAITDRAARVSLLRSGRAVSEQVLDGVTDRLRASRTPGFRGSIAGHDIVRGADWEPERLSMAESLDQGADGNRQVLTEDDLMTGTGFSVSTGEDNGSNLSFWGRTARSGFSAGRDKLAFDGKLSSFMIGIDRFASEDAKLGMMFVHSRGKGTYNEADDKGEIRVRYNSVIPYVGFSLDEGLHAWGALGVGEGKLTLDPEGAGKSTVTDASWRMAAAGIRGVLIEPESMEGFSLDAYADGLLTRTRSDRKDGLEATSERATRLRAGIEGHWEHGLTSSDMLTSRVSIGLRHDGGDAETGTGIEIGAGIAWREPGGIGVSLDGNKLLNHDDRKFESWSLATTLSYDPNPGTRKGFSAQMGITHGGTGPKGDPLLDGAGNQGTVDATSRGDWQTGMSYGVSHGNGMVGSSYMQLGGEEQVTDARMGYRIEPDEGVGKDMNLDLWLEPGTRASRDKTVGMGLHWGL